MRRDLPRLAALAVRRPDLLWRKVRGLSVVDIDLDEIAPHVGDSPVILEAGAFNGLDTVRFVERWPMATIHAFEPVPSAFLEVEARTRNLPQVRRYPVALSDRTGTATMHVSTDLQGGYRPDSSSLLAPADHLSLFPEVAFGDTIEVETHTLDDWASLADVDHIDFMWLDMQGMELRMLQASPSMLATTKAVCMEVASRELYKDMPMYSEVVPWMKSKGFLPIIDRVATRMGNVLFVRR